MSDSTVAKIDRLDWPAIADQLDAEGYAVLPGFLEPEKAKAFGEELKQVSSGRLESLSSSQLGQGEIAYFNLQLPIRLTTWRKAFYPHLAFIANRWAQLETAPAQYPSEFDAFHELNWSAGQLREQSHLCLLRENDHLALHQRAEEENVFPLQLVALLSEPGKDFSGGEFVMTEQRPRMQSRPMVLPLKCGDLAIIATAQRPYKGAKGYYRVNIRHAVSRVRSGERVGLELLFHGGR